MCSLRWNLARAAAPRSRTLASQCLCIRSFAGLQTQAMIAGRFLAGVGIGLSSALVPLYISEVRALPHQPIKDSYK